MLVLAERCLHFAALVRRQFFCWTFDVLTPCKVGFQIFWRLFCLFVHLSIWFDVVNYTNFERKLNLSLSLCTLQSVMADDNNRTGTSKRAANVSVSTSCWSTWCQRELTSPRTRKRTVPRVARKRPHGWPWRRISTRSQRWSGNTDS